MLEVTNVDKIYSVNSGIRNISLYAEKGETVAIIGPNGAGKSTLFSIISGVMRPDKGRITVNGLETEDVSTRKHIGYLPDSITVNPQMKMRDLLYMVSDYKYQGKYKEEIDKAITDYQLEKFCDEKFFKLSMGIKKKVGVVIAFLGMPELIILDEPTNGMDTQGILQLKMDIIRAKKKGSVVLISSHILDFVGAVADKNIFLKDMQIERIASKNEDLEKVYKKLYLYEK